MHKRIDNIAFHEAGHAVAHVLAGMKFKYVTIKEREIKKEYGGGISLGGIEFRQRKDEKYWSQYSFQNPTDLNKFFRDDFTKLAG